MSFFMQVQILRLLTAVPSCDQSNFTRKVWYVPHGLLWLGRIEKLTVSFHKSGHGDVLGRNVKRNKDGYDSQRPVVDLEETMRYALLSTVLSEVITGTCLIPAI
jgi:hypothetical protein